MKRRATEVLFLSLLACHAAGLASCSRCHSLETTAHRPGNALPDAVAEGEASVVTERVPPARDDGSPGTPSEGRESAPGFVPGDPSPLPLEQFLFVTSLGRRSFVVLSQTSAPDWATGAPRLVSRGHPIVVERDVRSKSLPSALAAWRGRRVVVRGEHGEVATATIGRISLIRGIYPFSDTRDRWDGLAGHPPMENAVVAGEAWDLAADGVMEHRREDGLLLVGALEGLPLEETSPRRWLWAAQPGASTVLFRSDRDVEQPIGSALAERFRMLEQYDELQDGFRSFTGTDAVGPWDHVSGGVSLTAWRSTDGSRTYYVAEASTGQPFFCGDSFYGRLSAVYEMVGGRPVPLLAIHFSELRDSVTQVFDLDGDGRVEILVGSHRLLVPAAGGGYGLAGDLSWPDYDGGC